MVTRIVILGGGPAGYEAALVAATGNLTETGGATIAAKGLIADAGAGVAAGNGNMVGTLTGTAKGGSFSFTNGQALTVGNVGTIVDVFQQPGVTATQDVALTTTSGALSVTGTVGLTAGSNIILASNGAFNQSGTLAITSPDLVIDTTGATASALLTAFQGVGGITSAAVITNPVFKPSGNSNPIKFGGTLTANSSIVLLLANGGAITGGSASNPAINVGQLGVSGTGGSAALFGCIGTSCTTVAAEKGRINPASDNNYRFNDCAIGSVTCIVFQPLTFIQPQAAREIDVLVARPAEEDIDAPLINIFDEERVCEELLRTDPKRAREVCR